MTGTDLCVNKCKQSRSYLNHLVFVENRNFSQNFKLFHAQMTVSPNTFPFCLD